MKLFFAALFCLFLTGCQRAPTPPPFDVPALIGQPIESLTQQLGAPAQSGAQTRSWTRDGTTLTATFKPGNGRVLALELLARDADHALREGEQNTLLEAGQLQSGAPNYSTDWIEAPDKPLFYVGVRVVPTPKTYQVEVRVSGPKTAVLQIAYVLGAQSDVTQTIAPWNQTATLADDAKISLEARLAESRVPVGTPITVEIWVDGKSVVSATKSVVARCEYEL